ncbi:hypothetical protein DAPPUDRAFT_330446 [Daphnia pulex]|uniref:Uncharacterized protein n=1 Tax=Daphnia pulex TaxID=6669 RepID=E9HJL1_DAPPU|nr:hypothetical protein DAPPUDRAFT_330446 [Daphnia pulex]|eukprot:EFX68069.1 hypothetical protein DAPPUDRAFT_330446 [Daphnia pulex]
MSIRNDMFASKTRELGKTGLVKHHINTEGQGPIRLRAYRIHQNYRSELEGILQELLSEIHVKQKNQLEASCVDFDDLRNTTLNAQLPEDDETSDEESEDEFNENVEEESVHHESNEENDPITVDDSGAQGQIPPQINGNASCVDNNGARQGPVHEITRRTAAVFAKPPIAPHADGHPGDHVIEVGRSRSPRTRRRPARCNEGIDEAQLDQLEIDEEVRRRLRPLRDCRKNTTSHADQLQATYRCPRPL